jgi:mannosyl-oligosaccharide alpha-1,2-mannosidase
VWRRPGLSTPSFTPLTPSFVCFFFPSHSPCSFSSRSSHSLRLHTRSQSTPLKSEADPAMKLSTIGSALALLLSTTQAAQIQSSSAKGNPARANAVKTSFLSSFNDYLKYAKGYDALMPISKNGTGGFGDWGATWVDAITTAHVMGLDNIVKDGIVFINSIDFDNTSQEEISIFETNIRYVGGLLSLHELTGKKHQSLVKQANVIGKHLLKGWVNGNDLPYNTLLNWNGFGAPNTSTGAYIAEGGTLLLELSRLSKYTGDKTYLNHAEKSMKAIINSEPVFPGLYALSIEPSNNTATNRFVSWNGGSDSFWEYLIKYGQLIGSTKIYIPTWVDAVKSSVEHLITKPDGTKVDVLYLSIFNDTAVIPRFSHLGCFAGGNWILGGKLLNSPAIVEYGIKITQGCMNTYTSSVTGIGPEQFSFKTSSGGTHGVNIYDEPFYQEHGFNYRAAEFYLRPEVLESAFYAYRATGDTIWQDLAWDAFQNILKYCKAPAALAEIKMVNSTSTEQFDESESFLYAELYKYLFLIFDDPQKISLDKYVFNTEGHPFELEKPYADYSAIKVGRLPTPSKQSSSTATTPAQPVAYPYSTNQPGDIKEDSNGGATSPP